MTPWNSTESDPWTGNQWQYRRLTELTVRVLASADSSPMLIVTYVFLEDEIDHLVILDDASVLAALNRLGAGGWQADPMETEAGDVPSHLMIKLREIRNDVWRPRAAAPVRPQV